MCGEIADAVTRAAGGSADDGEAARAQAVDAVQEAIDESLCRASEKGSSTSSSGRSRTARA